MRPCSSLMFELDVLDSLAHETGGNPQHITRSLDDVVIVLSEVQQLYNASFVGIPTI